MKKYIISLFLVVVLAFLVVDYYAAPVLADKAICESGTCRCVCEGTDCSCSAKNDACSCKCEIGEVKSCSNNTNGSKGGPGDPAAGAVWWFPWY